MITLDALREIAEESGFNFAGLTNLEPLPSYSKYEEWISAGYHSGMQYLANPSTMPTRRDPSQFFTDAKSIVFLGLRYPVDRIYPKPAGIRGRVASYAWGADYHSVIPSTVRSFVDCLESFTGRVILYKLSVDSSPVLEKPLASRAGLGWQGRNSCLIHPRFGSFFFLAGVFLSISIEEPPTQIPDQCGTCHRCVDACPTGCILPDRTIDAGRCLSYLTIENKGLIPHELRPLMGDWLFGCDICQSVCPWNKKPDDTRVHPAFLPNDQESMFPDLDGITRLTNEEFRHVYKGSPILRTKRSGLLRNAAVVLGNTGDTRVLPILKRLLEEESDPLIRIHAAWGIGRLGSTKSRDVLSRALKRETDSSVLEEIKYTLERAT